MTLRRFIPILVATISLLCMAATPAQACRRVVVRQSDDLEKVFSGTQTKYVIKDNIDLKGKKVKIGEGSTLVFRGGSLSNGTVVGNNTRVKAKNYEVFKRGFVRYHACIEAGAKRNDHPTTIKEYHNCLIVEGTWQNTICGTNWTGLQNGSCEDVMLAVKNYVTLHQTGAEVLFPTINALGYERAILPGNHVIDFNNSIISYPDDLGVWEDQSIALPVGSTPCSIESGYGLITVKGNTILKNLSIDGKSNYRQDEPVRLGESCVISIGNAQNVTFENLRVSNVLGPAVVVQPGAKDILYRNCVFKNIGEHVVYSHQYLGFCHFENCMFDTWDSERVSEYRNGLDYLYKHNPVFDEGKVTYDELYSFDLRFSNCTFNNPRRKSSQGRTLGAFFTGSFPVVINIVDCKFTGASPAVNPGKGCEGTEKVEKPFRLVVKGCDGAPYIYSSKANSNLITEFYDCVNIPFRTVYGKFYERCKLFIDVNESNTENVTPAFEIEFTESLVIKDCEFTDNGSDVKICHPIYHRPVVFEGCVFTSTVKRNVTSELITIRTDSLSKSKVTFKSCKFDIPNIRLVGGTIKADDVIVEKCEINALHSVSKDYKSLNRNN